MFLELFDIELFFFKRNNFSELTFFSKKMLFANFMRFRSKSLEKQTHIDNFFIVYIFCLYLKKIRLIFEKKIEKILQIFYF